MYYNSTKDINSNSDINEYLLGVSTTEEDDEEMRIIN